GAVPAAPAGAVPAAAATVEGDTTGRAAAGTTSSRGDAARGRRDNTERQWRELAGAGHTQLSRSVTIRVRDALRPSAEEITEAEATVEIRRRNWTPPPASG
nr:hypothetical protein [Actinomycetota bacterium]